MRECAGLETFPVSNWSASFIAEAPSFGALGPVSSTQFPRLLLFHLFLDFQKFVEISHVLNGLLPISFIIMSCAFLISLLFWYSFDIREKSESSVSHPKSVYVLLFLTALHCSLWRAWFLSTCCHFLGSVILGNLFNFSVPWFFKTEKITVPTS